jgi:branched-chain amino acid transport system permease protein
LIGNAAKINQFSQALAYAVAILGLNLLIGYSGQLSIGHSAFVGLGAYATIILVADHQWSFFATFVVAVPLCFIVGILFGLPALRIRGLYLAIVTLALAFAFPTLVLKFESLTGGPNGKRTRAALVPPEWTPFDATSRYGKAAYIYFVLLVITAVMFLLAHNMLRSRAGRAVIAVRDNQTSAAVCGVNIPVYKTMIFGVSAAFGGVAGTMQVMLNPFASDTQFSVQLAILLVVGLVVGGAATLGGAIPGALLVEFIPWYASEWSKNFSFLKNRPGAGQVAGVLFGLLLLVLVFALPGGVVDGFRRLRSRIVRVIPNPPWLRGIAPARPIAMPILDIEEPIREAGPIH